MHRIASVPGEEPTEEITLVEQNSAPIIFLTSATSDITSLSTFLDNQKNSKWDNRIRGLALSALNSKALIDHYIYSTCSEASIVIVRLIGSKSYWGYGLEQLQIWKDEKEFRKLIVLSGVSEFELELNEISNIDLNVVSLIQSLLNEGGEKNIANFMSILDNILKDHSNNFADIEISKLDDPLPWKWENKKGAKVAVILYSSYLRSSDTDYSDCIINSLNKCDLVPRVIWLSSLRLPNVQSKLRIIFKEENIKAIITTTSFASTEFHNKDYNNSFWDSFNIPILQLLTSSSSMEKWQNSSIGLSPVDLTLQIVIPELDGRITTIPGAFKEVIENHLCLNTVIHKLKPHKENIEWVCRLTANYIKLRRLRNMQKKICLVVSNYPIRDGRIANGVGLDTPNSICNILNWLKEEKYNIGDKIIPTNSKKLIDQLLKGRTNSLESNHKAPLHYLPLREYLSYWNNIPPVAKKIIIKRWGNPEKAIDLDKEGFPICGINYGNITILIQPSRGYDPDNVSDLHSPDLPPPHRYIAQYIWLDKVLKADAIVHVGKHGSLEWLPGKGVGVSTNCFPHILTPPLPSVYPFIVNDPGEGSQAKRRINATIIDHLTPPLDKSDSYGRLIELESLFDEYFEAKLFSDKRTTFIEDKILEILISESWPGISIKDASEKSKLENIEKVLHSAESYLCEIKEAQIRTGLHIFGSLPIDKHLTKLILSISKAPTPNCLGLTQNISSYLGFILDPWSDEEGDKLDKQDIKLSKLIIGKTFRRKSQLISWIDVQAEEIIRFYINKKNNYYPQLIHELHSSLESYIDPNNPNQSIQFLNCEILPRILDSSSFEKKSFLKSLSGHRIISGPSGAPSRGNIEVLPTGRNFYSIDIRGVPSEASWDLGKRSAKELLDIFLLENGEHLKHLAMSIWGTSTMRNGGEDISQLFALIGIQPIWDYKSKRIIDLEVIPLTVLNRPRVDVTLRISGLFRDAFPQIIDLIHRGQQIISQLDEPDDLNPQASSFRKGKSTARIYGSAPGAYGAGLQEIINSGSWESKSDLANAYIEWSKWTYQGCSSITIDREGLEERLNDIQIVIHNQDNKEHDLLDSDDYYQFHGGLVSAVEQVKGTKPKAWIVDHSRYSRPRIRNLSVEIDKIVRSRMLNPKWIEGMIKHGYKGGFEMSASVDYLFSYDATTNMIPNWCYRSILNKWLSNDNIINFLHENNPWALRDMGERLIEASGRNLWNDATKQELSDIKNIVIKAESIIEKGGFQK